MAALVAFVVVSLLTLAVVRPIVRSPHQDAAADPDRGGGAGRAAGDWCSSGSPTTRASAACEIDGDVWTARSLDDDHVIEPGTVVDVVQIKGATALVSE